MTDNKSVLFVCTGNIFRSMTAEYALRSALPKDSNIFVQSAGTEAMVQPAHKALIQILHEYGIDVTPHRQRRVTQEILGDADLVVAMGKDHQEFLKEQFNYPAVMFRQVCYGDSEGILDVHEAIDDWKSKRSEADSHIRAVATTIISAMPHFIKNLPNFLGEAKKQWSAS